MGENRFLIDDDAPKLPRKEKVGVRFQLRWQRVKHSAFASCLFAGSIASFGFVLLYVSGFLADSPFESSLLILIIFIISLFLLNDSWLGLISKRLISLYDWLLHACLQRLDGERHQDQAHKQSHLLIKLLTSHWFLGAGLGGSLLIAMGFALGLLSSSVAWIMASSALGAALSKSGIDVLNESASNESDKPLVSTNQLIEIENAKAGDAFSKQENAGQLDDEALGGDDVAAPFVRQDALEQEKQSVKQAIQDTEAAIEGIDPSLLESANQDLLSQMETTLQPVSVLQTDKSELPLETPVSDSIEDAIFHV